MEKVSEIQKAFVSGVKAKLLPQEWGSQAALAKRAGIKPSYLCDILNYRKNGTETTRRSIASALGVTYEEILNAGRKSDGRSKLPFAKSCSKFEPYTELYASGIYKYAAQEMGIEGSHFFTDDSLKKLRPPGWVDYLDGQINEAALYKIALKEMGRLVPKSE